ncbi:hypothetical protein ACR9HU_23895 (plasmid) [Enterobacter ludwigii]
MERPLPDDVLTVSWNGTAIHTYTLADPDAQAWPYTFQISPDQLTVNGTHRLDYNVTADSGATSDSDPTAVRIDQEPPIHGNVPPSLIFPDEVMSSGITLEYLAAHNNEVIATVPSYADMEAGQVVHPFWSTLSLPSVTVTQEDVDAGSIAIPVSGTIIQNAGEGIREAHYYLSSRAGFDGLPSEPVNLNVLLTPAPAGLAAPVVPLAADGLIDLPDVNAGVTVEIAAYDNARNGDLIVVTWGDTPLQPATVVVGAFPLEIPVQRAVVVREGTGTVTVGYQVVRNSITFDAPTTEVEVDITTVGPVDPDPSTPENEALAAPTVRGNSGLDNEMTPEDYDHEATVIVPFYPEAAVGEIVTVYWGQAPATLIGTHTVAQGDLDNQLFPDFIVPLEVVDATPNDAAWPVYYTLSRPAGQTPANPVLSPARLVNVHMVGPGGPDGLSAAVFTDASASGWLLTPQVQDGVRVHVAVYEYMQSGDIVTLDWQAFSTTNAAAGTEIDGSQFSISRTVGAPELANGVDFVVPYEGYVDAIAGASPTGQGAGQALYSVTQGGSDYNAPVATVRIDLGTP